MPFLASCPLCVSVGVKSSCLSEMLAPQQRDTYTLFMVRWLRWKQDLSHINHKRFELGQDSCKGTEIRQCILYSDTLQKENVPHARIKMDPSPLLQSLRFLFKSSEAFLFSPCWCPDCWVWVMSAAADHLSLIGTISLIVFLTVYRDWIPALGKIIDRWQPHVVF